MFAGELGNVRTKRINGRMQNKCVDVENVADLDESRHGSWAEFRNLQDHNFRGDSVCVQHCSKKAGERTFLECEVLGVFIHQFLGQNRC